MPNTKIHGEQLKNSVVRFTAKAGENLTRGQAVYISGISGEVPVVSLADADDAAKIPAFGLAEATVSTNAEVDIISFGTISGLDTSGYSLGDTLFIDTTAGALTNAPAGGETVKLQNIGKVQRVHASNGSIKVGGAGRTAATPNLNQGKIFIGDANNKSVSSAYTLPIADGTDGQVLTTDGSGAVAFEALPASGPTFKTFGTSSIMIGDTTTGTIDAANYNVGLGVDVFAALTSGDNNAVVGFSAGKALTTGIRNTLIGALAGDALTTGQQNTALGFGALSSDTKGQTSVAIGKSALESQNFTSDTATYNTAVGYSAGTAVTTGTINTLIGGLSGDALTIGNSNVAVGYDSLGAEVAGDRNVAIGVTALKNQTNASTVDSYNTAVGYAAGLSVNTGVQNTLIGGLAGDAINSGIRNVALGYQALTSSTTAGYQTAIGYNSLATVNGGLENTAVGANCLTLTTTGSYNTAVGTSALYTNNSGSLNTVVGHGAGIANTTGQRNVFIGASVAPSNQGGNYNTGVGGRGSDNYNVLNNNTTGSNLTALGAGTLARNTTGTNNTAVGVQALYGNTIGIYNVAVGTSALSTATTVNANTGIGYNALRLCTGTQNTALGYEAGGNVSTGFDNVLIGQRAANYTNNLTTGSDNTVIGAYARLSSGTVSDELVIGRFALGQGGSTGSLGVSGTGVHIAFNGSTTAWSAHSDERLKENIVDSTAGLSFINDLRPITYNWKSKKDISDEFVNYYDADSDEPVQGQVKQTNHGFIAQEIKATIDAHPEIKEGHSIWRESPDGVQNVADGALIPMLVKAIQELSAQNAELTTRIEALEG